MIKEALKEITIISEDENDNIENYLDSLTYIDNLYKLIVRIQETVDVDSVKFLPSFKGAYIVERLGIPSDEFENELRYFVIKSPTFISDNDKVSKIKKDCNDICIDIIHNNDIMTFKLR